MAELPCGSGVLLGDLTETSKGYRWHAQYLRNNWMGVVVRLSPTLMGTIAPGRVLGDEEPYYLCSAGREPDVIP